MDRDVTLKELHRILKRFTLEQIKDAVLSEMNIISWETIKKTISCENLSVSKNSVINIIFQKYQEKQIKVDYLKTLIGHLYILHLSLHHNQRNWKVFKMSGNPKIRYKSYKDIQESIESAFFKVKKLADIIVKERSNIFWIRIVERKQNKKGFKMPYHIALFPGQPYLFSTAIVEDNLQLVSKSLDYSKIAKYNLTGCDINSLMRLLKSNKAGKKIEQVEYKPVLFTTTERGIDFTQQKCKEDFVNKCYSEELPLKSYTFTSQPSKWCMEDTVPELKGKMCGSVELTIKTSNMNELIKEMSMKGILPTPAPEYLRNAIKGGVNSMTINKK